MDSRDFHNPGSGWIPRSPPPRSPGSSAATNGKGKANCLLMTNGYLSNKHQPATNDTHSGKVNPLVHHGESSCWGTTIYGFIPLKLIEQKVSWKKGIFDPRHKKVFKFAAPTRIGVLTIHLKTQSFEWNMLNISIQQTRKYRLVTYYLRKVKPITVDRVDGSEIPRDPNHRLDVQKTL